MEAEPAPALRDNQSGLVLAGRYRLQLRLAAGGMGEVYEAKHVHIPRRFAVKLLRPEFARDPQMQARFRREAETVASLASDHIVEVADFGYAEDGSPYLVMELLEGVDLRRLLAREGLLPVAHAVAVVRQACEGVAAAHEQGVVHRDLKPENLFLARRAERTLVKVLDFGIAKLRNHQSLGTGGGKLLGTPAYMPPEQIRSDDDVDQRADVYALGVILYEALAGGVPHPGSAQHEIISHVLFDQPASLCEQNSAVPVELGAIVHRALAASPDDRFQTVRELSRALSPFAGTGEIPNVNVETDAACNPTPAAQSSRPELEVDALLRVRAGAALYRNLGRARKRQLFLFAATLLVALSAIAFVKRPTGSVKPKLARKAPLLARDKTPFETNTKRAALNATLEPLIRDSVPPTEALHVATDRLQSRANADAGHEDHGHLTAAPLAARPSRAVREPPARRYELAPDAQNTPSRLDPIVIKVPRGDRTITFKNENPLIE